ncbi:MAG: hypothetical protein HWE27_03935 [Gammaproteobacteria bacterium]|nr:hypothetical protein [Gammaproteobacteria bacterium]
MTVRIAMWSGPRNISTAMMRSWENRSDCEVVDEPFYACYLSATGLQHPCTDDILKNQSTDWQEVIHQLTEAPKQSDIFYQKHMTHHILPDVDLSWTQPIKHVFLIRDPKRVIASYKKAMPNVTQDDIGIIRQGELYDLISQITGQSIPIIDSADVLQNPRSVLSQVCRQLDITFDDAMLQWPAGKRDSDGVWASHWYHNVEKSTGFSKPRHSLSTSLSAELMELAKQAMPYYEQLHRQRIRPE